MLYYRLYSAWGFQSSWHDDNVLDLSSACSTIKVQWILCHNCSAHVSICTSPIESQSLQMSLCSRPGQLFPGILQRITAFLNVVVYTACSLNRFKFLKFTSILLDSASGGDMHNKNCWKERKKERKRKLHYFRSICQDSARACGTGEACAILQILLVSWPSESSVSWGDVMKFYVVACQCMKQIPTAHW